ncbi:uncharacterized protein TM35_000351150 [Trypanosoma theileri]|uniref:Uncharacterized protein n=1 Tax=Trypanosoma theileri TaxID=67003 RepID=A0A1X0NLB3_9TRYP|nr:uncharacterized protein TM35_000351150 [Trypanosoma theileri]ORC85371.1 hypothetical protein TM35_000351150 [Trypanosoma theileri]
MSRVASVGRRRFVGPFTRIKAWWLGIDPELLERYGERGIFRSFWMEWRGVIIVVSSGVVIFINHSHGNRANEILENIELNRQRHYKRDFAPEYVMNAPAAVYDGAKGYAYRDEASGLMLNADNQLVTDLTREEQRKRLEGVKISPEMVEAAKRMRNSSRYQ